MRTPRSTRARHGALALVAVGSLFMAACGGDDNDAADTPAASTPVETPDTMAPDTMAPDTMAPDTMAPDTMAPGSDMMGATGPGCAAVPTDGDGSFSGMADDPAATAASNNPLLSTLVAAVDAAGLVDTLNGDGPFTIFAPVNDAFAAIPKADLDAVLADKDLLTSILTHHVVAGEKMSSADLIAAGEVETVNGDTLTITEGDDGSLMVDGAKGLCIDVPTANATVHIIDMVLMPAAG